jgi:ATP-binding cassette subfamily B protein
MIDSSTSYRRLVPFLAPQKRIIVGALACTAGFVMTTPLVAYLVERLTRFLPEGRLYAINELAAIAVGVFIVRGLFQYGQDALMAKASLQAITDLRSRAYAHLQTLDLAFLSTQRTGDLTYRLTADIDRLGEAVRRFFHQFIPCVLTIVAVLGYLIYLNWQLTVVTLVIAPVIGWLFGWFGNRLLEFSNRSKRSSTR